MTSEPFIFRYIEIGQQRTVFLGERFQHHAISIACGPGERELKGGTFGGAAAIVVELASGDVVRAMRFRYSPGNTFERMLAGYTDMLGEPSVAQTSRAEWSDGDTKFSLWRDAAGPDAVVQSRLEDLAVTQHREGAKSVDASPAGVQQAAVHAPATSGMTEDGETDRSRTRSILTCTLALALTWWPFAFALYLALLEKTHRGASIAVGYVLHFMIVSWLTGVAIAATSQRGRPATLFGRLVLLLALLPLPLVFLKVPLALAS